ncbi:hypothetical protein SDRG_07645 [Saprolegnia diclina VS20]|uniref:Serine aminopeptidase S33 domain-containing protein n=1 Tax=Saprolegnia diclina (strain VS20) TaxID=1156394 RepID=T0QJE3_SAPDV|nr:hypothetical protein SDRG_07645 [Saprolegnia diclina VS20]EQC34841.1 hypothetical protein SDRG_07645 [Saprolegnia diclina VS20]|eukprot:XP_008611713.1 hypothetical protein SDRG_07645 [Saprolegnia diclina VS20]
MGSGASVEVFGDGELETALKAPPRWSSWDAFRAGFNSIVNAIVRPPRHDYKDADLGPTTFVIDTIAVERRDFTVCNETGATLVCSLWAPIDGATHCVLYVHGMSGSRVEGLSLLPSLLQRGVAFAALDCAGSGKSDGAYVSLGLHESRDLLVCVRALQTYHSGQLTSLSLWGHCMGANAVLLLCNALRLERTHVQRTLAVRDLRTSVKSLAGRNSIVLDATIAPCGDEPGIEAGAVLTHINGSSVAAMGALAALSLLGTNAFANVEFAELQEHPQPYDTPSFVTWLVLDSGFTDLTSVLLDMVKAAQRDGLSLPSFLVSAALALVRASIKRRAGFDPQAVAPHAAIEQCHLPAIFLHATQDDFVQPHHSEDNFKACGSVVKHYIALNGTRDMRRSPSLLQHVWPVVDTLQGIPTDQIAPSDLAPWATASTATQWTLLDESTEDAQEDSIAAFSAYTTGYRDLGSHVVYLVHVFAPRGEFSKLIRDTDVGFGAKEASRRPSSPTKEDDAELRQFWETACSKTLSWRKSWRRASTGSAPPAPIEGLSVPVAPNDYNADGDLDFVVERRCHDVKLLLTKLSQVHGSLHTPLQRLRSRLAYSTKMGAARLRERQELLNEALRVISTCPELFQHPTVLAFLQIEPSAAATLDWSLVPLNATSVVTTTPLGCTCKQPTPVTGACSSFTCACACDVTAGICDARCCCDPECSPVQVAAMQGSCLATDVPFAIPYCDASLVAINTKYGMLEMPDASSDAMCVYVANSDVSGTYYAPPTPGAVASSTSEPSYQQSLLTQSPSMAFSTMYRNGDFVQAYINGSTATPNGNGFLMLPAASLSSFTCLSINPIAYTVGGGTVASRCHVLLDNVTASCTDLGMAPFVQKLSVATTPRATTLLPVTLTEAKVHTVTDAVDVTGNPSAWVPSVTVDTQMCTGVLQELTYTITHDGNGTILSVQASVVLGSVPLGATSLPRTFRARFVSTSFVVRSQALGNLISYERSGNPGYLDHLPLRAGVLSTNGSVQAIAETPGGFPLLQAGPCASSTTSGAKFGRDLLVSCSLPLSLTDFKAFCLSSVVPQALQVATTHVAAYGNADPFKVSDWVAVTAPANATSGGVYSNGVCTNVITSAHIFVSYTLTGDVQAPQRKITSVLVSYAKENVIFGTTDASMSLLLSTTLTYREVASLTPTDLILPAPDIWFTLPSDVFYPFLLASSARRVDVQLHGVILALYCWMR